MRIVSTLFGGGLGLAVGAALGFALALWIAKPQNDGTFAMREMLVCLPIGALVGLAIGIWWGLETHLFG